MFLSPASSRTEQDSKSLQPLYIVATAYLFTNSSSLTCAVKKIRWSGIRKLMDIELAETDDAPQSCVAAFGRVGATLQ